MHVCILSVVSHVTKVYATSQFVVHVLIQQDVAMWPDWWKPNIMVHTKTFSIKHYKNSVQKTHFIKYLQWLYKGHNLAMLTPI